jgi:iron complex transport system substrate-binding protein
VTSRARASRIVALAPSCAEILFALGAAPRVVGVSDFARGLPEAETKTRVGGFAPDLERIARLAPDLVIVSKDGTDLAAVRRLESLGYRVLVTDAASLDGVLRDVTAVGRAIGETARGEALVLSLGARIAAAEERARARAGPPLAAVAVVWPDPPVLAGPGTFVGDVLARARLANSAPEKAGLWPRVSFETLAAWDPRVLVRPETPENRDAFAKAFAADGRWHVVGAAREGRVVVLPGDLLERPGPRLVDALERLVEALEARAW